MNKANLLQLADALEHGLPAMQFDMSYWLHTTDCGTAGCIAGHAAILSGKYPTDGSYFETNAHDVSNDFLELTDEMSNHLFTPSSDTRGFSYNLFTYREITAPMAAAVVRHLAETGEVDWSVANDYRANTNTAATTEPSE